MESYQSPKQDKMISLIAWLIIASLLFYVAVFTFESFLKKNPGLEVSQTLEVEPAEVEALSKAQPEVKDLLEPSEPISVVSQAKPEPVEPLVQTQTPAAEPLVSEQPVSSAQPSEKPSPSEVVAALTPEPVNPSVPAPEKVEKAPVQEVSAIAPVSSNQPEDKTEYVLKVRQNFTDPRQALAFVRQLEFEGDVETEILGGAEGLSVFIGQAFSGNTFLSFKEGLEAKNHGVEFEKAPISLREELQKQQAKAKAVLNRMVAKASEPEEFYEDPIAARKAIAAARPQQNGPLAIQIGAFSRQQNADQLSAKMNAEGYASYVESAERDGVSQYRVLVGNFDDRAQARVKAEELKGKGLPALLRTAVAQ